MSERVHERLRRLRRCYAPALAIFALACAACGSQDPSARRDVLLVILDTARADHFSTYGYSRKTTPNFDRLAEEGRRYDDAWAQSPWTLPALATILTGYPPHRHGAGRGSDGMFGLESDVTTLAQRLAAVDYNTAAFINVIWCSPRLSSLDRGFAQYDFAESNETNRGQRNAEATTDAALAWLGEQGDTPFFVVLHYFDPHLTYDPPAPFDTRFDDVDEAHRVGAAFGSATDVFKIRDGSLRLDPEQKKSLIARYDGELRYTDEQFGRLREGLEQLGRWDDTLVIVVADHGEEFWDHGGFEHGHSHHRELLRVPLIVRDGKNPGAAAAERVRQLDIVPTVLDFAGIPLPDDLPGKPLGTGGSTYAVAEGSLWGGDLVSARSDRGTLILDRRHGTHRFYGSGDPLELTVAEGAPSADAEVLLRVLRALPPERSRREQPRELTEEQIEELRSLGYLR